MDMCDIEVDSLPPMGGRLRSSSYNQEPYINSARSNFSGLPRDSYAFHSSRELHHPSDSVVQSSWEPQTGTNSRTSSSSNNVLSTNNSSGYNFSYSNNSVNNQSNITGSQNSVNNSTIDSGLSSLENLTLDGTNSSFVFNRPSSEYNNRQSRQLMQLQNSKYPSYKTVPKRIESFLFSISPAANHVQMSEAGFFAISNQDYVRCFHCGIGLRNWEEDDDPFVEHCRWSPNCQYMKIMRGQAFINAVQEAVRKVQLEEALGESETRDAESDGTVTYADLAEDGDSNESYPRSVLMKNPLLSNAAQSVIEMGYLPRIVRKAVDTVVQNHGLEGLTAARIADIVLNMEANGEKVRVPVRQEISSKTPKPSYNEEIKKQLIEQNREMKEKLSCVICCENERAITFLPCGHLVCCAQCAPACSSCAVCRKEIKGTVKVSLR